MKTGIAALLVAILAGTSAFAGGPVVVVEEEEVVVEENAGSSTGILPFLLIPVAICLILCGDNEDQPPG